MNARPNNETARERVFRSMRDAWRRWALPAAVRTFETKNETFKSPLADAYILGDLDRCHSWFARRLSTGSSPKDTSNRGALRGHIRRPHNGRAAGE